MKVKATLQVREGFFNVRRFAGGTSELLLEHGCAADAATLFSHYISSSTALTGQTRRVIVTNALGEICLEWVFGEGLTVC